MESHHDNDLIIFQDLMTKIETAQENYQEEKDTNIPIDTGGVKAEPSAMVFKAGQSKRIWNELYKVSSSHLHTMSVYYRVHSYCLYPFSILTEWPTCWINRSVFIPVHIYV